jgi:hypothetical protein
MSSVASILSGTPAVLDTGGVTSLTSDGTITVSPNTGAVSVVVTPGIYLPVSSAEPPQVIGSWGDPPYTFVDPVSGRLNGLQFTLPRPGNYMVVYNFGFNTSSSQPTLDVFMPPDSFVSAGLMTSSITPISTVSVVPITMSANGTDYNLKAVDVFFTPVATTINPTIWITSPVVANVKLGLNTSSIGFEIYPLC